jgi:hypothetical protein
MFIVDTIKKILLFGIGFALFKIYEGQGFTNAVTISVLAIIFGLWLHMRLEAYEEEQRLNEELFTPPMSPDFRPPPTTKPIVDMTFRRKQEAKFRRLSRSRSR